MVRGRVDVGVTMFSCEAPFADGAGDDSAVLESNTSPERETYTQESKHSQSLVFVHAHTHKSTILSH